jgi:sugar/nucleoside kinase (ribokinase family)
MDLTWDLLLEVIAKTDVITINDEEARQLSGEYSLVKAAQKIHDMGPEMRLMNLKFIISQSRIFQNRECHAPVQKH